MAHLILASASPQRRAILAQLGIEFEVDPAEVSEMAQGDPIEVVCANAQAKAVAVAARRTLGPDDLVLGVDTVVALDGVIYGKPAHAGAAADTLRVLSGKTHEVHSGFSLIRGTSEPATAYATTLVTVRTLTDAQIAAYVAYGEWRGRAGGFAIQERGAALICAITGDYLNVVGLPVAALLDAAPELTSAII